MRPMLAYPCLPFSPSYHRFVSGELEVADLQNNPFSVDFPSAAGFK